MDGNQAQVYTVADLKQSTVYREIDKGVIGLIRLYCNVNIINVKICIIYKYTNNFLLILLKQKAIYTIN